MTIEILIQDSELVVLLFSIIKGQPCSDEFYQCPSDLGVPRQKINWQQFIELAFAVEHIQVYLQTSRSA
jgi:hypothetical protein